MLANLLSALENGQVLLGTAALLLALGFRRNRYALAALAVVYLGLQVGPDGGELSPPWALAAALWLWIALWLPEPPVLSIRSLGLIAALLSLPWWVAPDGYVGASLAAWASLSFGFAQPLPLALWICLLAYAGPLWRWLRHGSPLECLLLLALTPLIGVFEPRLQGNAGLWLALCAFAIGMAVLIGAFRMAYVDALTGLPNRRALDERLSRATGRIAVAMVDVDHFKRFNDRYGHESGDRVLQAVARALRRCRGGTAYRYGGEEFSIIFEGRQVERASESLERVREAIETQRVALGRRRAGPRAQAVRRGQHDGEVGVTVSIGLAERDPGRRSPEAIVDAADKALYRSKQRGRNRLTLAGATRS